MEDRLDTKPMSISQRAWGDGGSPERREERKANEEGEWEAHFAPFLSPLMTGN